MLTTKQIMEPSRLHAVLAAGQRRLATTGVPLRDMSTADLRALRQQLSAETEELYKQQHMQMETQPGASPEHRKYNELFQAEDKAFFELRDAYVARYGDVGGLIDAYGNYATNLPEDLATMLANLRKLQDQKLRQRNVLKAKFGRNRWMYYPPIHAEIRANNAKMEQIYRIIVEARGESLF